MFLQPLWHFEYKHVMFMFQRHKQMGGSLSIDLDWVEWLKKKESLWCFCKLLKSEIIVFRH